MPQQATKFGIIELANDNIEIARAIGVKYIRLHTILSTDIAVNNFNAAVAAGLKVLLNVDYFDAKGTPFFTDLITYKAKLSATLTSNKPELLVVENEENNFDYHTDDLPNYLALLNAAISVAKPLNIPVANGGITCCPLKWFVHRYYTEQGNTAAAQSFGAKCIPINEINALNSKKNENIEEEIAVVKFLLNAYASTDIDFVNIHWYEPAIYRNTSTAQSIMDTVLTTTSALQEVVNIVAKITGKKVMSNEMGTMNESAELMSALLQEATAAKLEYCVVFDGNARDQTAAYSSNGILLLNGVAIKNFIAKQ